MKRAIVVFVLAWSAAATEARAGTGGVGVGAGVVQPGNAVDSSLFLTGNLRFTLLGPVALEPEVGYWKQSGPGIVGQASTEDLNVGVNGLLVLPLRPLQLFGGVGIGAHFIDRSASVGAIATGESRTKTGVHLLAGLGYEVSSTLDLFGAARHDTFSGDGPDGEDGQTKFYGGLRFKF